MSIVGLKGTLFEQHIQATQAHALFLARSADAHCRHILKVLTATLAVRYYQDVILIPTTEALRHTIRTVQMSEAEYASYNIESPFVRAKNYMAKLAENHIGDYNYNLTILSDLDGYEYLFKMTKIPAAAAATAAAAAAVVMPIDKKYKEEYDGTYAVDMYERLVWN